MSYLYSSGNEIVDEVGKLAFIGDIIPHTWYKTILRDNGKPYLNAIIILADITYWYRPSEVREESSGQLLGFKKKFKEDLLQRSYSQMEERFGMSKREATNAIIFLEKLGVIERVFRTVKTAKTILNNVLYINLNVEKLEAITFPEDILSMKQDEVKTSVFQSLDASSLSLLKETGVTLQSEAREEDEAYKNAVYLKFEALEELNPNHFAVRQYKKYKLAAGKTAKSILISCGARLAPFDIKELRDLMEYDKMELDIIGDRKTALFIIISDTDDTFNFVVAILYTQLFNLLCDKADDVYNGRLPIHVRCLLDEFSNIGQIPKFEKLIATIRSREISASVILQAQSQLKGIYKDHAETIVGNCDTTLFLGGKEKTTLKEISEILGKETIDLYNTSENRGREKTHGLSYQKLGKSLMTQDELATMDGGKCILQLRGVRPFLSEKYDVTKHKNYKKLSDYNEKNTYDIEKVLNTGLKLKKDEEIEIYEI